MAALRRTQIPLSKTHPILVKEAANITGCRSNNISLCCKGKQKTAGGYRWGVNN